MGNYYYDHTLTDSNGDGITDSAYAHVNDEPDDDYPIVTTPDSYTYLENGLVAYYPFTGNADDESEFFVNDGTVFGATPATDIRGNADNAYQFDGSNDYIDCSKDASLDVSESVSITAWINLASFSSEGSILSKRIEDNEGYQLKISNSPQLQVVLNTSLKAFTSFSGYDNQWVFVAATSDGTDVKLFINGTEKESNPNGAPVLISRANLYLGKFSSFSYFNGSIDEVRIYNRTLSQAEITKLYNDYRIKFNPGVLMMLLN